MEKGSIPPEYYKSPETVPTLVEVNLVAENPTPITETRLVYCPPIMGGQIDDETTALLLPKLRSIYSVDIQQYGYPTYHEYTNQTVTELERLPDYDREALRIVGFSEGASLAARIGRHLQLPQEHVLLVAPIISFRPSKGHVDAWRAHRRSGVNAESEAYLKRLLNSPERIYFASPKLSKIEQLRALNRSRIDWTTKEEDLAYGVVVTGSRDFIAPPEKHSNVTVDAGHSLKDYKDYLLQSLV